MPFICGGIFAYQSQRSKDTAPYLPDLPNFPAMRALQGYGSVDGPQATVSPLRVPPSVAPTVDGSSAVLRRRGAASGGRDGLR